MTELGTSLSAARHHDEAVSVQEAELSMRRRLGDSKTNVLVAQSNLARAYYLLGRRDEALLLRREVYSGFLKHLGEESIQTLTSANNYGESLVNLKHFEEARSLLRKTMPVTRRVLGESHDLALIAPRRRWRHARRAPRSSDDARGSDTGRAARARWHAPNHNEY